MAAKPDPMHNVLAKIEGAIVKGAPPASMDASAIAYLQDALDKMAKVIAVLAILCVVLMLYIAWNHNRLKKKADKFGEHDHMITPGVLTSDPNSSSNLINRISGSTYSAHQGSVAAGGLFEKDPLTNWQGAPFRTDRPLPNLHCEPDEIEGISMVTDAASGKKVRVVSCYDKDGAILPPKMKRMGAGVAPGAKEVPCAGSWDYGAEGELGAQNLMSNMVAFEGYGEAKLEDELRSMN